VNSAPRVRYGKCLRLACGSALYFSHHLAQIEFGNDECFHFGCEPADLAFWEGPRGDQSQLADAQTLFTSGFDGSLRHPGGDSVGDNDDIGAFELLFFEQGDAIGGIANLALQAANQFVLDLRSHVGIAAFVVSQPGNMKQVRRIFAGEVVGLSRICRPEAQSRSGHRPRLCPLSPFQRSDTSCCNRWACYCKSDVLVSAKNSPSFAAGDHDVLHTLDRLHILRTLEGRGVGTAELTHAALHLMNRFVFVLVHP